MIRVLIGIPTYSGHGYCLDEFVACLRELDFRDFDVIFVDNSEGEEHSVCITKAGFSVIRDRVSQGRKQKILHARNTIRDYFLQGTWDCLFFVDSDVMVPRLSLSKLILSDADVTGGVYLSHQTSGDKQSINPVLYDFVDRDNARIMNVYEVLDEKTMPVAAIGLGCCLIRRRVLQAITFRIFGGATEDVAFSFDVRSQGFSLAADTSVKCVHLPNPRGDPRNEDLDWANWEKPRFSYSFVVGR